ncbi:MAG: winged helix-turn-helix domain-containing protein, partial [Woeseiaceae bacterium]
LMGDRIVARVDLKADRKKCELLVLASHPEADLDQSATVAALASELRILADWLGLERLKVSRRGLFARALADHVRDNAV